MIAKRAPKDKTARGASVLKKIEIANQVARLLQPRSYWVIPSYELGAGKIEVLLEFLAQSAPTSHADARRAFIESAAQAVIDYRAATDALASRAKPLAALVKVDRAATALANAWSDLCSDRDLSLKVRDRFCGLFPSGPAFSAQEIVKKMIEWNALKFALSGSLRELPSAAAPLAGMLSESSTRGSLFAHWTIFRLGTAWLTLVGEPPTVTRNKEAVSGPQATLFQQMLDILELPSIGSGVIRDVVETRALWGANEPKFEK